MHSGPEMRSARSPSDEVVVKGDTFARRGLVVWFTGRPASGKSTLARHVARRLSRPCVVLDGDAVRSAIVPPHGYTSKGRDDFYTTLVNLAALLSEQGLAVLVPATAHRREYRAQARASVGRFMEVYVATAQSECECRDPKGLYRDAKKGVVQGLPGSTLLYEEPAAPDIVANGGQDALAVERIVERIQEQCDDSEQVRGGEGSR